MRIVRARFFSIFSLATRFDHSFQMRLSNAYVCCYVNYEIIQSKICFSIVKRFLAFFIAGILFALALAIIH